MSTDTRALARSIRLRSLHLVHQAKASHIGSCLSMADILAVLYGSVMRHDPKHPGWDERDMLVVSKGHAAVGIYAALAETGYIDDALLSTYGKNGTILQGHASHHVPGVELSTGSLGHGLSVACGLAVAAKADNSKRRIFVILSDGELDEGSNWEAILFAPHHKLDNLSVIVDYNKIQSFGPVKDVLDLEPLADKWKACRWHTQNIDGHNHTELMKALTANTGGKPGVIIANTIKGKGVSFMEGTLEWHYKSPSDELLAKAIAEIEAAP